MKLNTFALVSTGIYVAVVGIAAATVPSDYLGAVLALAVIAGILVGLFVLDELRTIEKARQRGQKLVPWQVRARRLTRGMPFRVVASLGVAAIVASAAAAWMKSPGPDNSRPMPSLTHPDNPTKVSILPFDPQPGTSAPLRRLG